MQKIICYKTQDGKIHQSKKDADKHIDTLFGKIICPLASNLTNIYKYVDMLHYLETNLEKFEKLSNLKKDLEIEELE